MMARPPTPSPRAPQLEPMSRRCLVLRHLAFEGLGVFAEVLEAEGYTIRIVDAPLGVGGIDAAEDDLLIILGGPIGAYEGARYPFLAGEIALIGRRLALGLPMLGICLGAQLIARAAGAAAYPGPVKEIGFAPVDLVGGAASAVLAPLAGVPVLHWHGDTFDLPEGAIRLGSTAAYPNQGFALGAALGLQFHAEILPPQIELWLVGHAAELSAAGIDPAVIRRDAHAHGGALTAAGRAVLRNWLLVLP